METDLFKRTGVGWRFDDLMRSVMRLHMFLAFSMTWALHQETRPLYRHRDPVTSKVYWCEQCPAGTAVLRHCGTWGPTACTPCPEGRFSDQWHWDDTCQFCSNVCKERQLLVRECNRTHDRLCQCVQGYHLQVEFCVKHSACPPGSGVTMLGTPESDTVCEKCRSGFFSPKASPTDRCNPHRNCTQLGTQTLRPGTATRDTICEKEYNGPETRCPPLQTRCHTEVMLCEETIFHFLAWQQLPQVSLEVLWDRLPGRRVERRSLEQIRKGCNPQEQALGLLRLWRERNKDQEKLFTILRGVKQCKKLLSKSPGLRDVTLNDLWLVMNSLPGAKVKEKDLLEALDYCQPGQQLLQLLHVWKIQNPGLDLGEALSQSLQELRHQDCPRRLQRTVSRLAKVLATYSVYTLYQNMFFDMIQSGKGTSRSKAKKLP